MRGHPLGRLIVVIGAFLAMGVTIGAVLRLDVAQTATASNATTAARPAMPQVFKIEVDFVHPPAQFRVLHLGKTIMEGRGPQLTFSRDVELALPSEGIELVLEASWPKNTPLSAVRLQCATGGDVITDRTFWGRGDLTQVILVR